MIFSIQRFLSRGYRVKHSYDSNLAWAREGEELVPASVLTHAYFA